MKAERWDDAIILARDVATRMDQVRQVATFSFLLIELSSYFLEKEEPYKAIAVLRLIRSRSEILDLQKAKLAEANADLQYATGSKNAVRQTQIAASLKDMEKDLENIEKVPQFDSASRLPGRASLSLVGPGSGSLVDSRSNGPPDASR